MAKRRDKVKGGSEPVSLRLVGLTVPSAPPPAVPSDPVHEAAVETAMTYVRRLRTDTIIALIPALVEGAAAEASAEFAQVMDARRKGKPVRGEGT